MERSSYFIENKALFGSFPTQESVNELEQEGVRFFVNLTFDTEKKIEPYKTNHTYLSYPIRDRHTPTDFVSFACFVLKLTDIILNLQKNELLYLHCKGGHGRSGVVVAILLCHIFKITPSESLQHTTLYHSKRRVMREKWRQIGSPQTYDQKKFIFRFCKEITFCRSYKSGHTAGFSNFSPHPVFIKEFGLFPTSEAAIQAYKCPTDTNYVKKQLNSKNATYSKHIGDIVKVREDWDDIADELIFNVLKCKFNQHPSLRQNLLSTGLRPIVLHTKYDSYWGDGGNEKKGLNKLGVHLTHLREYYYRQMFE